MVVGVVAQNIEQHAQPEFTRIVARQASEPPQLLGQSPIAGAAGFALVRAEQREPGDKKARAAPRPCRRCGRTARRDKYPVPSLFRAALGHAQPHTCCERHGGMFCAANRIAVIGTAKLRDPCLAIKIRRSFGSRPTE